MDTVRIVTAVVVVALVGVVAKFGVRGLLVKILAGYRRFRLFLLGLQGKTERSVTEQRVVSGQAWDEFCDTLKAAGAALVHGDAPTDPFNQVGSEVDGLVDGLGECREQGMAWIACLTPFAPSPPQPPPFPPVLPLG